jgi:hypothetical protein
MTRARAKAIHDKVNLLLNTLDLQHTMDGLQRHLCSQVCTTWSNDQGRETRGRSLETLQEEASAEDGPAKAGPTLAIAGPTG